MRIVIAKESLNNEKRVALTPEGTKKLIALGYNISVMEDAGVHAGFSNEMYTDAGAVLLKKAVIEKNVDLVLRINPPTLEEIASLPKKSIHLSTLKPHFKKEEIKALKENNITSLAMDLVPRITRAQNMDVLSSQSNLSGYRAVIEGAHALNRAFPLMMTAAGTIAPARVLILGAGVAGLQAIATAKRLGAIVSAFDVRAAAKEQVESLGATFVSVDYSESGDGTGGYAKEMSDGYQKAQKEKLISVLKTQDLVITTALIPGKKAPLLIDKDMVEVMKPSSVIIDMATETGGNCSLSKMDKNISHKHVLIMGPSNLPSHIPFDASQLFSRNIVNFLQTLNVKEGLNFDDEIIKAMCVTHDGKIVHDHFKNIDDKK